MSDTLLYTSPVFTYTNTRNFSLSNCGVAELFANKKLKFVLLRSVAGNKTTVLEFELVRYDFNTDELSLITKYGALSAGQQFVVEVYSI